MTWQLLLQIFAICAFMQILIAKCPPLAIAVSLGMIAYGSGLWH
jgi:hypothetical protein